MAEGALLEVNPVAETSGPSQLKLGKTLTVDGRPLPAFTAGERLRTTNEYRDRQGNRKELDSASIGIPKEIRENFYSSAMKDLSRLVELQDGSADEQARYNRI